MSEQQSVAQETDAQSCEAMGATTGEHAMLKPFVGTFAAEVTMYMGPEPIVSTGTMTNSLDLGGRFLHQSYQGDPSDGPFPPFQGRGHWGYNTGAKRWEGFWIDTATTAMQREHGDVDESGTVWTMASPPTVHPGTGQEMTKTSIIRLHDEDHHTLEMHFKTPDGEFKGMEIKYSRRT